ncbi:galactoside 3(4)-L-fucosyltransferase-like [Actinia tenebrosa]|uniref:Fucosyltransferase n=1 Tax=Actinia tenebrosa TaxID=6105 RepID=A0A6P8IM96_ACTTE|nr:galactoside 3(4)-L-fucosyltransferase-like [Actinia tenebrosa]
MNSFLKYLKWMLVLLVITTFITILFVYEAAREQVFYLAEKLDLVKPSWMSWMAPLSNVTGGYKIILFYTPYFRSMPWPQARGKEKRLTDPYGRKCKVSSCYVTYSRQDFSKSNAVVFHTSAMPSLSRMESLLWKKTKGQKWVWYGQENPENMPFSAKTYSNMFDWTITYRTDSNVLDRYGYYVPITSNKDEFTKKNFIAGKDRLILWLASNCVSFRLSVVKEISKYLHVDVYGKCQRYFDHQPKGSCTRGSGDCDKMARRYKFYLALENFNCRDYVTEKYWRNALAHEVVPVLVAGSYSKDVLIPGSYIDILDFPNAKSLASYLKYLDSNDTAYNRYFEWKKNYTSVTTTNWLCDLCELLHRNDSDQEKEPLDMGTFWGTGNCHADDAYIRNVWLKSDARGRDSLGLCCLSFLYSILLLGFHVIEA